MSPRRSRREVGRSLRAPDEAPTDAGTFPQQLARTAAASEPSGQRVPRRRTILLAGVAAVAIAVGSLGLAYGTGAITPPWRPPHHAPATPSPTPASHSPRSPSGSSSPTSSPSSPSPSATDSTSPSSTPSSAAPSKTPRSDPSKSPAASDGAS